MTNDRITVSRELLERVLCRIDTAKIRAAVEAAKKAGWPDDGLALVTELCDEIERLRHENGTPLSMLGVDQLRQENDDLRREIERLRKDAERQFRDVERYRFLRDMDHWPAVFTSSNSPEPTRGNELDECIDKEMESKT